MFGTFPKAKLYSKHINRGRTVLYCILGTNFEARPYSSKSIKHVFRGSFGTILEVIWTTFNVANKTYIGHGFLGGKIVRIATHVDRTTKKSRH